MSSGLGTSLGVLACGLSVGTLRAAGCVESGEVEVFVCELVSVLRVEESLGHSTSVNTAAITTIPPVMTNILMVGEG